MNTLKRVYGARVTYICDKYINYIFTVGNETNTGFAYLNVDFYDGNWTKIEENLMDAILSGRKLSLIMRKYRVEKMGYRDFLVKMIREKNNRNFE